MTLGRGCLVAISCVLASPWLPRSPIKPDPVNVPVVTPVKGNQVTIEHRGASWFFRLPAALGTADRLLYYPREGDLNWNWRTEANGEMHYSWSTPDQSAPARVGLTARLRPSPNRIDLSIEVSNRSTVALVDVWSDGGDLRHRSERFMEKDYERTFIRTRTRDCRSLANRPNRGTLLRLSVRTALVRGSDFQAIRGVLGP